MKKVTMQHNEVKALLKVAPTKHIKYWLNGILLEFDGRTARAIATDGSAMLVLNVGYAPTDNPSSYYIPREATEAAIKQSRALRIPFSIEEMDEGIRFNGYPELDIPLPEPMRPYDWRRVVPTQLDPSPGFLQFDGNLLANVQNAIALSRGNKEGGEPEFAIQVAKHGSVGVIYFPHGMALIMPLNDKKLLVEPAYDIGSMP